MALRRQPCNTSAVSVAGRTHLTALASIHEKAWDWVAKCNAPWQIILTRCHFSELRHRLLSTHRNM